MKQYILEVDVSYGIAGVFIVSAESMKQAQELANRKQERLSKGGGIRGSWVPTKIKFDKDGVSQRLLMVTE